MNLLLSDAYDQPRDPEREQPLRIFSHRKLRISVQCVVSELWGVDHGMQIGYSVTVFLAQWR